MSLLFGLELKRPRRLPQEFRQRHLIGSGGERETAKVLLCVTLAAEQSFFFAGP